jgi:hypothetical protein
MRASHSEILCYLDCRVKHHLRYRLRLPVVNGQAAELDKGSAVHTGMEYLARLPGFGGPDSWKEAQSVAATDLRKRRLDATQSERLAVQAAVRAGHAYLMAIECQEVLGVERKIQPVVGTWTPNGVIDFIWRDRYGNIHIDDWKTCKDLGEPTVGVPDGQTALYAHWALEHFGLEQVHAGRVYLRTEEPTFEITKGAGKFSLQNKVSYDDYTRFLESTPFGDSPALDDAKARERFGAWWRADIDIVTPRLALAILKDQRAVAQEIAQELEPVANRRPKFCIRCEYLSECVDRMTHGDFDPTFTKAETTDGN